MRLPLQLHPDFICEAATRIEVELSQPASKTLELRYLVTGTPGKLLLPALGPTRRADRLWEHSCFEVFVRAGPSESYYEFNFAPSCEWAGYRFESHRSGMSEAEVAAPGIETKLDSDTFELRATIDLGSLPELAAGRPWRIGLSAVIEESAGQKSYWALAHPPGKADFHHPDCFALDLPPAA